MIGGGKFCFKFNIIATTNLCRVRGIFKKMATKKITVLSKVVPGCESSGGSS